MKGVPQSSALAFPTVVEGITLWPTGGRCGSSRGQGALVIWGSGVVQSSWVIQSLESAAGLLGVNHPWPLVDLGTGTPVGYNVTPSTTPYPLVLPMKEAHAHRTEWDPKCYRHHVAQALLSNWTRTTYTNVWRWKRSTIMIWATLLKIEKKKSKTLHCVH